MSFASEVSVLQTPVVKNDSISSLGTVLIEISASALKKGDITTFKLPEDFILCNDDDSEMTQSDWVEYMSNGSYRIGNLINYVEISQKHSGYNNGLSHNSMLINS